MLDAIFISIRNLTYYRISRQLDSSFVGQVKKCEGDTEGLQKVITDAYLATVGLKTVAADEETIPWYIFLSKQQKFWIKTVSAYGYKVGLR